MKDVSAFICMHMNRVGGTNERTIENDGTLEATVEEVCDAVQLLGWQSCKLVTAGSVVLSLASRRCRDKLKFLKAKTIMYLSYTYNNHGRDQG